LDGCGERRLHTHQRCCGPFCAAAQRTGFRRAYRSSKLESLPMKHLKHRLISRIGCAVDAGPGAVRLGGLFGPPQSLSSRRRRHTAKCAGVTEEARVRRQADGADLARMSPTLLCAVGGPPMLWWLVAFWFLPPLIFLVVFLLGRLTGMCGPHSKPSETDSIAGGNRALNITDTSAATLRLPVAVPGSGYDHQDRVVQPRARRSPPKGRRCLTVANCQTLIRV